MKLSLADQRPGPQHVDRIDVEDLLAGGVLVGGVAVGGILGGGVGGLRYHLFAEGIQFSRGIAKSAKAEHPLCEPLTQQEVVGVLADGCFEHGVGIAAVVFGRGGLFGKVDQQAGKLGLGFRVVRAVAEVSRKQPHRLRRVAFLLFDTREPRQCTRVSGNLNPVNDGDGDHRGHGKSQHCHQQSDIEAFRRAIHRLGGLSRRG